MSQSIALHTLGCKLNFSETTAIGRMLELDGFVKKKFDEVADLYVINTCSVTENADKECRYLVRKIKKRAPDSLVVITGCYAQLKPQEIAAIPGVNLVLGAAEKFNLGVHLRALSKNDPARICSCDIDDVNQFVPSHSTLERTRVFLKVQDGCDYNCSFCTIPLARGGSRSNSINRVTEEVKELALTGAQEIVLTGINLGDFGRKDANSAKGGESFLELIEKLDEDGIVKRFRISSVEPNLLSDDIISFVSTSKRFMPHFHIPLQSGSNRVLSAMRRRYRKELYANRVRLIKNLMPHACIGADVIVGFPGETKADFEETVEFIRTLPVSYLHVFTYSERDNTHALTLGAVVPISVRNERNRILRTLSYEKNQEFVRENIGQKRQVLFETADERGMLEGYTDNYIKIRVPETASLAKSLVEWLI